MGKTITWTPKQREIAEQLRQGKPFMELIRTGYGKSSVSKVMNALKKEERPPSEIMSSPPPVSGPRMESRVRQRIVDPVQVGSLLVTPEDWYISQHGVYLILDTYYLAKEELGYEGTIGEFIRDMTRFYRQCMHYPDLTEVGPALLIQPEEAHDDNGREEADQGGGVPAAVGPGDIKEGEWSAQPDRAG